jgi:hypothetical protein
MSETLISLLSAFVGAIVGGTASLAGTMVVNRRQMTVNARMRLYDELLPKLADAVDSILDENLDPITAYAAGEQMPELLGAVRRASAIAGRSERKAAHDLWVLWIEHVEAPTPAMPKEPPMAVNADPPPPPGYKPPPSPAEHRLGKIQREIQALSDHLGAKLG